MKYSNLAECLGEFADVVARIDPADCTQARIHAVAANTEMQPRPRPVPARRRIQIRDQGLRAFRVF